LADGVIQTIGHKYMACTIAGYSRSSIKSAWAAIDIASPSHIAREQA
jgi:hypothetical protein